MTETIKFEVDSDGIALMTIDLPGRSMNVINGQFMADLTELVDKVVSDDAIKGAVITSAKNNERHASTARLLSGRQDSITGPPSPPLARSCAPAPFRCRRC